jgi:hypothetical protein
MIVKESDIRAKIRRLLAEEDVLFKYYDASDRERTITVKRENDVIDLTTNPVSSNILHSLTKPSQSYIAWNIIFEKLFIKNNTDTEDKNISKSNNLFADVKWNGVYYSIKSTLQIDATIDNFQNKAYSGNPTFTKRFVESCIKDKNMKREWGIIVASKIGNDLIWQTIGNPTTGEVIYEKWALLPPDSSIKATLEKGYNTKDVIEYFFGNEKKEVFRIKLAPPETNKNKDIDVLNRIYDMIEKLEYEIETNPKTVEKANNIEKSISSLIDFIRDTSQVEAVSP